MCFIYGKAGSFRVNIFIFNIVSNLLFDFVELECEVLEEEEVNPHDKRYEEEVAYWEELIQSEDYINDGDEILPEDFQPSSPSSAPSSDEEENADSNYNPIPPITGEELVARDSDTFSTDPEEYESDKDTVCDDEEFPWEYPEVELGKQKAMYEKCSLMYSGKEYGPREISFPKHHIQKDRLSTFDSFIDVQEARFRRERKPKRVSKGKWTYPPCMR